MANLNLKHGFLLCLLLLVSVSAKAEVVVANAAHYTLKHQADSTDTPEQVWTRLIVPSEWWHPDHTYSGSAANLSLDPQAGGLWREDWEQANNKSSSVVHGSVLLVEHGKTLRLDAPFGPLQGMGVTVVWTIQLEPIETGTRVTFTEIANGSSASNLEQLAPAVDLVKQQAISRLTNPLPVSLEN